MYSHLLALGNKSVLTSYYDSQCVILAVKGSKKNELQKKCIGMLRGDWPKLLPCKWLHLLTLENKYFDELLHL